MTLVESFNSAADIWAFWIGHVAWQAAIVAVFLLLIVRLGNRWPAPVRHGLLLLALLKFVIPPVTNLPVGVFQYLERLLSRHFPEFGLKIHQSSRIDFGGMTDDPQSFAQWHDTVFYSFAAQTLATSNIPAAEDAINALADAPLRSWVYSSAARSLPLSERTQAIKWLDIAYSLARKPGEGFIPLVERLADIAAGYRKYSADAAAFKVLQEAAIEAAKPTDSDRFEYGKRQVAKHLAAYDLPAALTLIGFDLASDAQERIDVADLEAQFDRADASERRRPNSRGPSDRSRDEQLGDVAITIADILPEAAERFLSDLRTSKNRYAPKIVHRMARVDPERAIRIAERIINDRYEAQAFGAIANAIADTNRDQARTLIRKAFEILAAAETPEGTLPESPLKIAVSLLPTVEKIDAEMIFEYLFRTLALRRTKTCGGKFGGPIDSLGRTGERNLLRLSDPVLAAAIARYDITIARQLAMAPGDTTLDLSWEDAPTFLLGAMSRIQPNAISFDAVNKTGSLTPWSQILPGLTLNQDEYWTWLMKEQFDVWEIGMDE